MNQLKAITLVSVALLAWTSAWAEDVAESVVGTWRMISCKVYRADGSVQDLYGSSPLGILMYDKSGHMSVHLLKPDLPKCGTQDRRKCPDAQARIAFDNYVGYWGRYEVRAAEKIVLHHIEGASTSDWIGTSQKRYSALAKCP